MTGMRLAAGWLLWPLVAILAVAHVGLGVLAAVEYARLDWLRSEPFELTAVSAVAATAALARIAHLEGQPPRPHRVRGWLLGGATVLNLGGLCAAVTCCAGLGVAMLGGMT